MADLKPWERDWNSEQSDSAPAPEAAKPWERDWTESASDTPARVNAMQAVGRNPAAVAEADKLARRHGVPVDVAERNAAELKRRSAAEEAADLAMSNPLTARWLGADPDNAAVAGGDWGTLKALETLFKFSPIGMLDSAVRASGAPRSAASGIIGGLGSGVKGAGEQVKALERKMTGGVQIKRTEGEQRLREAFGLDVNLIDLTKKATDTVGDTLKSAGQALAVPDAEKTFVDKFFEAAGTTVAGLGVSYINPMAGMALWSGAGADVQAERARAAGTYETENADTATLIGGQVTAITERIGYGWLMRALPAGAKKALLSRFGDLLLGGAGEAAQEVTENATQDTVTQALVDPSQQIGNYGEEGAIGFTVGLLFRGAGQIAKSGADARDAVAERDALTGMIDATQASSLFKTSPARFKDAVSQLKSQGMTDVYVPVEAWQTLFQSDADASDSARVAAGVSDADYAEALLSGGRIRVPVEGFLTELTAEQQTALAKDSRFKPGGFSPVDAASFDPDEAVTEYFKTAGVGRPSGVVTDVYNEYVSRLTGPYERGDAEYLAEFVSALTAGYGSRSGMQQEIADLWINNLSVAAEGRIPERLRKVLGERKDVVPEIDSVLDALRAGAYPKDADVFGPTLAEAVRSWGGVDPESFGAPDLRSQDAQRVGVLRKGGLMMEYALERAVQQGYLPEGSDLSDFLASMTQDMQGANPVYSAANLNAEKQARSGVMDQAAEELRERGIDLSKVSNSEARRLMGMQSARGAVGPVTRELNQESLGSATTVTVDGVERPALNSNGQLIHDTVEGVRNFWRWFGDSKVVDADGRPLVVYHGTPEAGGIDSFATSNGGIYLSSNEKVAYGYTAKRGMWLGESTGVVVDGFAALKNPLIIDAAGKRHDNIPVPWQEWKPKVYGNLPIGAVSIQSAAAYAKANGYDGLIVNNTIDTADIKDTKKSSVYVAFNPVQVKSATGNNGDFSPDDARILYQSARESGGSARDAATEIAEAFKRETGDNIALAGSKLAGVEVRNMQRANGLAAGAVPTLDAESAPYTAAQIKMFDKWQAMQSPSSKYLFHTTAAANLSSIAQFGLTAGNPARFEGVSSASKISLSANEAAAAYYAYDGDVMLRVSKNHDVGALDADLLAGGDGVYTASQTVPASALEVKAGKKWVKLLDYVASEQDALFQRNTQNKKRGSLVIGTDGSWVVNLLKARDWSTFLHESSHVQLEIMRQVDVKLRAADELTADQRGVLADHDALLKWMGADTFADVTVDMHEQFAETFEAYLREGKAPSPGLQSVFRKFSAWLKAVYFTISKLPNAKLNDDIRSVMDRMLATDAEIAEAQKEQGLDGALLAIEGYELTDDERERMAEAVRLAHEVAVEQEFKRQYAYEKREQQAWYRAERQRIRGEVAEELNADPVYQAAALMRRGTMPDGSPRTDGLTQVRMDSDTLLTMYSNEFIKRNLSGMYGKEGSPPDAIAALFGFDSGRAMIDALANQQPYGAFLKAETERRLTEQYPDPMTDNDAVDRAALAANNEFSDRIVMEEIRRTEARVGDGRPTQLQVMKEAARRIVAATRIMDLKPHKHRDSERRLGREALEAAVKGDFAEVLRLKRQQLMASLLFRQASEAQDASEKQFKHAQNLTKKPAQERLAKAAADYLEQINAILSAFEFRRATNKEISRRRKLSAWVDERQAAGDVTAVSEELLARVEAQATKNWREATVQEMNDAYEAMRNIEHLAGLKNKLLKARRAADRDEAVDEMLARVEQTLPDVVVDVVDDADLTVAQRAAKRVRAAMDDLTRPETIIEILDGGESGPFHDFIHYAQVQAESAKNALRRRVADQLKALHTGLSDEFWTSMDSKVVVNGVSTTRYTLLAAVMNMGNTGNRQRLRDGGFSTSSGSSMRLTDAQVDALPSMLTAAELQYVQGLWDVAESMRPDIEALQQRMAGIPINFVEAVPLSVTSSDGVAVSMRGGYWPIAYHSDRSAVGERQAGDDALQIMMGMGVSRAATSKGYTKDRVEEFSAPLRLNLGLVLAKNIDEVMTDVAYREAVRDVQGLLNDQRLKSAVISRLGKSAYNSLRGSLAYSVSGSADAVGMAAQNWRDFTDFMMANASVAALAIRPDIALGNYTSAVIQGLSRVERRAMMRGMRELWLNRGDMTAEIKGLSPFMADRLDDLDAHYAKQITRTQNSRGFRAAYFRVMMTLHRMADHDVTRAVWYGRYTQERAAGADQAEAVRIADKTIRTTQTASGRKDLGTYERDTAFKQTRMFMGPMFVIFGQVRNVAGGSGVAGSSGARIALGLNALFFAPAMFALMAGRWPDDDDDEGLDAGDWVEWLSVNCGPMFALQTMPIVREVAGAIEAAVSGKPVNPRAAPTSQAAATMVKSTKSLWAQGKDIADGEEADYTKLTADLLGVTAPLSGLPASQYRKSSKAIQWLMDNPEASAEQMAAVMLYGPPRE